MFTDEVIFGISLEELEKEFDNFYYKKLFTKDKKFYGKILYEGKEYKLIRAKKSLIDKALLEMANSRIDYFILINYNEIISQTVSISVEYPTLRKLDAYMNKHQIDVYTRAIKSLLSFEKILDTMIEEYKEKNYCLSDIEVIEKLKERLKNVSTT